MACDARIGTRVPVPERQNHSGRIIAANR
ncbi:protein of unknown function [Burkholderia multivorans]